MAMAMKVITGYFSGIIHVINGVFLVLITGISGQNCNPVLPAPPPFTLMPMGTVVQKECSKASRSRCNTLSKAKAKSWHVAVATSFATISKCISLVSKKVFWSGRGAWTMDITITPISV